MNLTTILISTFLFISVSTIAQVEPIDKWIEAPQYVKDMLAERTFNPKVPTSKFRSTKEWQTAIDSVWGEGIPTDEKLHLFDILYNTIDTRFACFQDIDDQWSELGEMYRAEIEAGVSRGRFTAILDHMTLSLRESHTGIRYQPVHGETALVAGVPLMIVGGWGYNNHFGAGLTPQEDGSLLVYKVIANHPLGLEVGDKILGYEGQDWESCYNTLLEEQLPLMGWWWGSSPSSYDHSWMMSAGMNWHLFETIDIQKYGSTDVQNVDLEPMNKLIPTPIFCTEQMEIPGVPMPDFDNQELFSFGIIEGTNIGYIYGLGWFWEAGDEFTAAINTLMDDYDTDGLIVDFRTNYGGNMFLSNPGLDRLFPGIVTYCDVATRCNAVDHLDLCPLLAAGNYTFGRPGESYEKPIALLTGPGAISSGDQVALRMKYHPKVRTFGKSTSTAFNAPSDIPFNNTNLTGRIADAEFYLLDDPEEYLTHDEFIVDEEIWLSPDKVREGKDDVVEAAVEWILGQSTASQQLEQDPIYSVYPNPSALEFKFHNLDKQQLEIEIFDVAGLRIKQMILAPNSETTLHLLKSGCYLAVLKTQEGATKTELLFVTK